MSLGGYPMGAQYDPEAPYNQKELPEQEITATVSITLSKTVKLSTNEYIREDFGKDEDGFQDVVYRFDRREVDNQIQAKIEKELNISEGWNIDEFEVIPENYEVF